MSNTLKRMCVRRARIDETKLVVRAPAPIADGEIRARVDRFALTANNVSYALAGETLRYWDVFPEDDVWGVVPVWGFAEVVETRVAALPVGARFWGFLPMASHVTLRPDDVTGRDFVDAAPHRRDLPALYNRYARTELDPPELAAIADMRSLLFPLFATSYLIADHLADNEWFDSRQVVIGSASSKTGFATAYHLRAQPDPPRVIGLTSAANVAFASGLGIYDAVIAYDDVDMLDRSPSVYVDLSGNAAILAAVHRHLGDDVRASLRVGATHWQAPRAVEPLPGAAPAFFFAPAQVAKRDAEWGEGETLRRAEVANLALVRTLGDVIRISPDYGAVVVVARYADLVANRVPPEKGLILSFGHAA